jgi:hypothetical protein
MIRRGKKVGCDFTLGSSEFNKWLEIIGVIPEGMKKPSVGRYDHTKGYVFDTENNRWNFRWQEYSENASGGGVSSAAKQLASGTHAFITGVAQRASFASQMKRGTHNSQTGRTGVHTGVAQRASAASPNRNTKKDMTCPYCDFVGRIPGIWRHIKSHGPRSK